MPTEAPYHLPSMLRRLLIAHNFVWEDDLWWKRYFPNFGLWQYRLTPPQRIGGTWEVVKWHSLDNGPQGQDGPTRFLSDIQLFGYLQEQFRSVSTIPQPSPISNQSGLVPEVAAALARNGFVSAGTNVWARRFPDGVYWEWWVAYEVNRNRWRTRRWIRAEGRYEFARYIATAVNLVAFLDSLSLDNGTTPTTETPAIAEEHPMTKAAPKELISPKKFARILADVAEVGDFNYITGREFRPCAAPRCEEQTTRYVRLKLKLFGYSMNSLVRLCDKHIVDQFPTSTPLQRVIKKTSPMKCMFPDCKEQTVIRVKTRLELPAGKVLPLLLPVCQSHLDNKESAEKKSDAKGEKPQSAGVSSEPVGFYIPTMPLDDEHRRTGTRTGYSMDNIPRRYVLNCTCNWCLYVRSRCRCRGASNCVNFTRQHPSMWSERYGERQS